MEANCPQTRRLLDAAIRRDYRPRGSPEELSLMLLFIKRVFSWWDGATLGALFTIFSRAKFVGEDDYGNKYYEESRRSLEGRRRRYVVYNGYADASRVPSEWHGWLHHTFKTPPTKEVLPRKAWEQDHRPNLTGTVYAYRPKGSLSTPSPRAKQAGDYEAWAPQAPAVAAAGEADAKADQNGA